MAQEEQTDQEDLHRIIYCRALALRVCRKGTAFSVTVPGQRMVRREKCRAALCPPCAPPHKQRSNPGDGRLRDELQSHQLRRRENVAPVPPRARIHRARQNAHRTEETCALKRATMESSARCGLTLPSRCQPKRRPRLDEDAQSQRTRVSLPEYTNLASQ